MFPHELPGLLPDQENEFSIDLVSCTTPTSKAPDPMAATELKQLEDQIQAP